MKGSIDDNPSWVRNYIIAKLGAERRVEAIALDRARREAKRNTNKRR
jgi:hypothetical protein